MKYRDLPITLFNDLMSSTSDKITNWYFCVSSAMAEESLPLNYERKTWGRDENSMEEEIICLLWEDKLIR